MFEFRPADWPEKCFSAQLARTSSRATLSPSYTKWFSSSIVEVAWPGKILVEIFTNIDLFFKKYYVVFQELIVVFADMGHCTDISDVNL